MKIPIQAYVCNMIRTISYSYPNWVATYHDLLRIRVVCTLVYLDGVMTVWYDTEYELKAHSNLVNMQCFESTKSCNISGFNWDPHMVVYSARMKWFFCVSHAGEKRPSVYFCMSSLILFHTIFFYLWANLSHCHIVQNSCTVEHPPVDQVECCR